MNLKTSTPELEFAMHLDELTCGLSAVLLAGEDLWIASDELTSIERLTLLPDGREVFGNHRSFELHGLINLPAFGQKKSGGKKDADQEIDIEGLDLDGGYLWLVGSHSIKRKRVDKADKGGEDARNIERLAKNEAEGNRYLLARIPIVNEAETGESVLAVASPDGARRAAQLPGTMIDNSLMRAILAEDEDGAPDRHLSPWLTLPGKDNGFDIEGLAVRGERVFLGLRGPVLRGWAVILELHLESEGDDGNKPKLRLKNIGPKGRAYRKHFLDLGGLGVRDLCTDGDDLLILAGPTMTHDAPVRVFRWSAGLTQNKETMVCADELKNRALTIPHGVGVDRAEGMTFLADNDPPSILVVYDAPCVERKIGERRVRADVFELS